MPKTADINMICNLAELSSLFEKSSSLDDFLQSAVSVVAYHMQAAVCSIYIYDEKTRTLTLHATQGLRDDAAGRVKLQLGQGLAGVALEELRPVREGRAEQSPLFFPVPGINEEQYQAFLAVPIRRGLARVGVLTVQDPQPDYFNEKDEHALSAIAAQLATVIENASLFQKLHREEEAVKKEKQAPVPKMIRGRAASDGIAQGTALFIFPGGGERFQVPSDTRKDLSLGDFNKAVAQTEQQLKELQREVDEELSDVAQLIFNAHLLILADDEFSGEIRRRIEAGSTPVKALTAVLDRYVDIFSTSPNLRLREKIHDLRDLGHRLLENLTGGTRVQGDYQGRIIMADELFPSDILKLAAERAEGFIVQGGVTAHNAIICRSLQKPMVMLDPQQMDLFHDGSEILIDGNQGTIYIRPSKEVLREYEDYRKAAEQLETEVSSLPETVTGDGTRVHLLANINLLSDLKLAEGFLAEGVGLYRSEFPFIIRNAFPSEEEQYRVYRKIVESMNGREVTFRTLDIGGDKLLSYQDGAEEANPFLGLRAIRFSLLHKDIFSEQLRAMLRAGEGCRTRIMFPLISSLDDFLESREVVWSCMQDLEARGTPFSRDTQIGIMVEVPSAVELIEDLMREVDFISIGTNDLIQYMLAVDRTNEMVSKLYLAHHPAILRAIDRVVSAAVRHGKDVSLCGDLATDPGMIPFLIGVGIRKLSISPRQIPLVQETIRLIRTEKAAETARTMLACGKISDVEVFLK